MIDIDRFLVSLMESDFYSERQKDVFRAALRDQFLECNGKEIRMFRQEYKFRVGDKVRNKATGEEAHVVYADERGSTLVDSERMEKAEPIYVSEWDLVPIEPKFKVGDKVIHKSVADKRSDTMSSTILGVDVAERRYKVGKDLYLGFCHQDDYVLLETHVDLSDANPQTRHQLLAIRAAQYIEEWFNGLSDGEKVKFADRYPELVVRKSEDKNEQQS